MRRDGDIAAPGIGQIAIFKMNRPLVEKGLIVNIAYLDDQIYIDPGNYEAHQLALRYGDMIKSFRLLRQFKIEIFVIFMQLPLVTADLHFFIKIIAQQSQTADDQQDAEPL